MIFKNFYNICLTVDDFYGTILKIPRKGSYFSWSKFYNMEGKNMRTVEEIRKDYEASKNGDEIIQVGKNVYEFKRGY